jgi:hypothetical protein
MDVECRYRRNRREVPFVVYRQGYFASTIDFNKARSEIFTDVLRVIEKHVLDY